MKRSLLVLALSLSLSGAACAQTSDGTPPPQKPSSEGGWGHHGGNLTDDERQELQQARQDALQADPDLAAEGQKLAEERRAYEKKLHDAMIKADPKVEPILAKMGGDHPRGGGDGAGTPPGGN